MNDKDIADINQALDEQAESLDGTTLSRLRQSRSLALEELDHHPSSSSRMVWSGVMATVASFALIISLWVDDAPQLDPVLTESIADTELLSTQTELELLEELEFYTWLAEEDISADEV